MNCDLSRRTFLQSLGVSAAAAPFCGALPGLARAGEGKRRQRLVVIFSPNGIVPPAFWPEKEGPLGKLKPILRPLAPFKDRMLTLHGVADRIRGDGDNHMRGIGCLLTGIELFPGNIQGGSHTPAGWSSGISIDQEIRNFLQADEATRTRFGSLEFGVLVPDRADTWTRMVYAGPNKPLVPMDDPYQMFAKLFGKAEDQALLASVLDDVADDLEKVRAAVGAEDRRLLDEQTTFVREMEVELAAARQSRPVHAMPEFEPDVQETADNMPRLSKMQIELMVNSFVNDFTRVATLQYTNSVGNAKMRFLGVEEGHHTLSHEPDSNTSAQEQLVTINTWYCQQVAQLARRLAQTPEPQGDGSLLDNTLILWTNELGKGNSHTLNDVPLVLVGGGQGFRMGRARQYDRVPHNRLLLSLAHAFGHEIETFGNADFCTDGPLSLG